MNALVIPYGAIQVVIVVQQSFNLLSSIPTILLTCPYNNTLLWYSNEAFLTVCKCSRSISFMVFVDLTLSVECMPVNFFAMHAHMLHELQKMIVRYSLNPICKTFVPQQFATIYCR